MSKLYVWTNSKLSSIQKGIQSSHIITELVVEFLLNEGGSAEQQSELKTFLQAGKVVVVLDGGSSGRLSDLNDLLEDMPDDDDYPYAYWREPDLEDAFVAVGLVLDSAWDLENRGSFENPSEWESQLLVWLAASRAI